MKSPGKRNPEFRLHLPYERENGLHRVKRTLVHRNQGLLEPALRLQMGGEVLQEISPIIVVLAASGRSAQGFDGVCRLIEKVELHRPRNHRITVDLPVDSEREHEFDPTVKNGVVIEPAAVRTLDFRHHRPERILRLPIPRTVHYGRGDGLLSGSGKKFHNRTHGFEMSVTPQRYAGHAGYGIGILPQIQMECPVLDRRQ